MTHQSKRPGNPAKPTGKSLEKAGKDREVGGRDGLEPTRYGDWEVNGICTDF